MYQGLTIYKSSAGSGKTFTLVLEFLKIIIVEPGQYRHVLAVTFTNKATEEMKSRIIEALGALATADDDELQKNDYYKFLLEFVQKEVPLKGINIRKQARKALNYILNDYSNFAVSTIESFFQRIVRAFARELNIPLGYDVEMRQDLVLEKVIHDTLLEVGNDPELTRLFVQFVNSKLSEEKNWRVNEDVKKLGREIFKESFQELIVQLGDGKLDVTIEGLMKLSAEVRTIREKFEKTMARISEEAIEKINKSEFNLGNFYYGRTGPAGYFVSVFENQDFEPKGRARAAYKDEETWAAKSSKIRSQVLAFAIRELQPLLRQLVDLYDQQFAIYNTALQVSRTIYSFGVLNNLREKLNDYRRENVQLLISDTNFLLNDIVSNHFDHAPFVYEKVGTQFYHYLLDEFQDTSEMQWKNIFPLLHESLSYGNKSLIVGDVKQSIYRWRNGDWKLLLSKVESDVAEKNLISEVKSLQSNWRTSREIVEFNNNFFEEAARILGGEFEDDEKFGMAYQEVRQEAMKTQHPGWVEVRMFKNTNKKNPDLPHWQDQSLNHLYEKLEEIRTDGFLLSEVTVLVRSNSEGVRVAEYLQEKDIQVVSAESLLLISDPIVRLIQALLLHLNHEDDALAMAGLTYYFNEILGKENVRHSWFSNIRQSLDKILPPAEKTRLRQMAVYACVEEILNLFPILKAKPNAYLQSFLDVVLEYSSSQDSSLSGFLNWWESEKSNRSIHAAPNPSAVQIMTIHKSKGLEFPIVFMPFANWNLKPKGKNVLWVQPRMKPYDSFSYFPVHPDGTLANTVFSEEYEEELIATKLDNLNILYVAFTRAKYRLYVNSVLPSSKSQKEDENGINNLNGLLLACLQNMDDKNPQPDPGGEGEGEFFSWGKSFVLPENADNQEEGSSKPQSRELRALGETLTDWGENIRIRYQISKEDFRSLESDLTQIQEGNLLHDALSMVVGRQDTEKAAHAIYLKGRVDQKGKARLKAKLEKVVNNLRAMDWFSGNWEVKNEAEIITSTGKILRPDRVMIQGQMAVVVDYKTGIPKEQHLKQLQRYKDVLSQMGYKKVTGYLFYLSLNSVEEV